jgi:hypothetical protein
VTDQVVKGEKRLFDQPPLSDKKSA